RCPPKCDNLARKRWIKTSTGFRRSLPAAADGGDEGEAASQGAFRRSCARAGIRRFSIQRSLSWPAGRPVSGSRFAWDRRTRALFRQLFFQRFYLFLEIFGGVRHLRAVVDNVRGQEDDQFRARLRV